MLTRTRTPTRRFIALAIAIALLGGAVAIARGLPALSCLPVAEDSIHESTAFTPYENRLTPMPSMALTIEAGTTLSAETVDGLPLRLAIEDPTGATYRYFLDATTSGSMTPGEFGEAGGIRLNTVVVDPKADNYVAAMLRDFPDRAVSVEIGGHGGVLTWADPDESGSRPHHVYWEDGLVGYELVAVRSAAGIVNLARKMACD